jgi:methionine aminopeptidase
MQLETSPVTPYAQQQILEISMHAAQVADRLLHEISRHIVPGMTENAARLVAAKVLADNGITRNWHKPYIYFGTNSILTFMDKPVEERILGEEDIAYIDIGPIIDAVEGDVGHTLVFGNNPLFNDLKHQSERIFTMARDFWAGNQPTGIELYRYIHGLTEEAGFIFHLDPAGHLIGTFPHKGWKQGLNTYPYPVEPGIWILEIQLRHPKLAYGAFREAVLI